MHLTEQLPDYLQVLAVLRPCQNEDLQCFPQRMTSSDASSETGR